MLPQLGFVLPVTKGICVLTEGRHPVCLAAIAGVLRMHMLS